MKKLQTSKLYRVTLGILVIVGLAFSFLPALPAMAQEEPTAETASQNDPCWSESDQVVLAEVTDPVAAILQALEEGLSGGRLVLSLAEGEGLVPVGDPSGEEISLPVEDAFACVVFSLNGRTLDWYDVRIDSDVVFEYGTIHAEAGTIQGSASQDERILLNCVKVIGRLDLFGVGAFDPQLSDLTEAEIGLNGNTIHMISSAFDAASDAPIAVWMTIESSEQLCGFVYDFAEGEKGQGPAVEFDSLGQYLELMPGYLEDVLACEAEAQNPDPGPGPDPDPEPGCPVSCPDPDPEPEPPVVTPLCYLFLPKLETQGQ